MKKIFLVAAAALIISGTVWGQTSASVRNTILSEDIFDKGNAVPTMSTEARYSAGQFTSDVDNFIDVNNYDPAIGTFFFLGGFPDNGSNVSDTEFIGDNTKISIGIGKTLKSGYLGIYYGGNLVQASGYHDENINPGAGPNGQDVTVKDDQTQATWLNRIAVLFGTSKIGAFRLDFWEEGTKQNETILTNDKLQKEVVEGPIVALTWGNNFGGGSGEGEGASSGGLKLYATIGVDFPDQTTTGDTNNEGEYVYKLIDTTDGSFFVQLGMEHSSGIWGDLGFDFGFPDTTTGDTADPDPTNDKAISHEVTGAKHFAVGLRGGYSASFDIGKVSVGLGPNLGLGIFHNDNKTSSKIGDQKQESEPLNETWFEFKVGVDLGVRFQITPKFALYTGASLQVFDFLTGAFSGGAAIYGENAKDTKWEFNGIKWQGEKFTGTSKLGFGLTFKPIDKVVIGLGLTTWLDGIISIDMAKMELKLFENDLLDGHTGGIDLTVSVKL